MVDRGIHLNACKCKHAFTRFRWCERVAAQRRGPRARGENGKL